MAYDFSAPLAEMSVEYDRGSRMSGSGVLGIDIGLQNELRRSDSDAGVLWLHLPPPGETGPIMFEREGENLPLSPAQAKQVLEALEPGRHPHLAEGDRFIEDPAALSEAKRQLRALAA